MLGVELEDMKSRKAFILPSLSAGRARDSEGGVEWAGAEEG